MRCVKLQNKRLEIMAIPILVLLLFAKFPNFSFPVRLTNQRPFKLLSL